MKNPPDSADRSRAPIRVVLVRTRGPRNAGLALRAVANFGPAELVLVAPGDDAILDHPEFHEMAHGVADPSARVRVLPALADALRDCAWSVGFTARMRQHREVRTFGPELGRELGARAAGERLALVFGNEVDGFSREESDALAELAWIPTSREHRSLNLGACVTVALAGLFARPAGRRQSRKNRPLEGSEREFLKRHLQAVLPDRIDSDRGRAALAESIGRIFSAAPLETRDAQAWHRLLRALGSRRRPSDLGVDVEPD